MIGMGMGREIICAFTAAVLGTAGAVHAATIKVPAAAPSITEAVRMASAGDTISIAAGTYSLAQTQEEFPIVIEKQLVLQGPADSTQCVIIPDGMKVAVRYPEVGCFIVRKTKTDKPVVLSRLSFGRVDRKAVAVDAYECHLVVQGCVFTRIDTAIRAAGGADARVTGCVLTNVEMGLSGTKAKVTFEKNQITGSKKSVQLDWASGTVSQNRIMNAIADGVALNQSSDVRISDNYIEKSAQCGISLRASSPLVTGNELVANKYGIWCTDRSAPEIKRNIVRRSLAYDVGCERGASPLVGGSLAEANYFYGDGTYLLHNLTDYPVDARYNYWGSDCPESGRFSGQVRFTPWTDRTRQQEVSSCN